MNRSFWKIFSGCFDVVVVFFAFFFSLAIVLCWFHLFFPLFKSAGLCLFYSYTVFLRGCVVSFPLYCDYETLSATAASEQFPFVAGESNSDLLLFLRSRFLFVFFFVLILLVKLYCYPVQLFRAV